MPAPVNHSHKLWSELIGTLAGYFWQRWELSQYQKAEDIWEL